MTDAERLAEAEAAYQSLMVGTMPRVIVDQNGERVEFTPSNATRLYAYIISLRNIVNPAVGNTGGPARFFF